MNAVQLYNRTNNSFKKKIIFHVGTGAGFYSEINGMLIVMLYCYVHKIKFILYADDATFAGGRGWNEFFRPFCPQSHDGLNHKFNGRNRYEKVTELFFIMARKLLKARNGVQLLTADIFEKAYIDDVTFAKWPEFAIDGDICTEFAKLRTVALRYNEKTFLQIEEKIKSIHLPAHYHSVQFRGGDKVLEVVKPMDVDCVIHRIKETDEKIVNMFIFADDFSFVEKIKEKCPEWNIYTLTNENEHGYINADFNKISWSFKRKEMIKLFAMTEICIHSDMHFGCAVACVDDYIRNVKAAEKYKAVWTVDDAGMRDDFSVAFKKYI